MLGQDSSDQAESVAVDAVWEARGGALVSLQERWTAAHTMGAPRRVRNMLVAEQSCPQSELSLGTSCQQPYALMTKSTAVGMSAHPGLCYPPQCHVTASSCPIEAQHLHPRSSCRTCGTPPWPLECQAVTVRIDGLRAPAPPLVLPACPNCLAICQPFSPHLCHCTAPAPPVILATLASWLNVELLKLTLPMGEHSACTSSRRGRVPSQVTVTALLTPGAAALSLRNSAEGLATASRPRSVMLKTPTCREQQQPGLQVCSRLAVGSSNWRHAG